MYNPYDCSFCDGRIDSYAEPPADEQHQLSCPARSERAFAAAQAEAADTLARAIRIMEPWRSPVDARRSAEIYVDDILTKLREDN